MKRSKTQLLRSLAAVMLLGAGLASCSQDDLPGQGEPLPEGKYPLELTAGGLGDVAVPANTPAISTRGTVDNDWQGVGEIAVSVNGGTAKKYEAIELSNGNKTAKLKPINDADTYYWQNSKDEITITAWYPYEAQTNVDISKQSGGFDAFDFLTATAEKQSFGSTVNLQFQHQMAKVSYTLQGDGVTDEELKTAVVTLFGDATATFENGVLAPADQANGEITSCYDGDTRTGVALLVPQDMTGKPLIKVSIGDNKFTYTPTVKTAGNLQAGYHNTYNITVKANGIEVTQATGGGWTNGGSEDVGIKEVIATYDGTETEPKIGDYYYFDGTWSDGGLRKLYADGTMEWAATKPQPKTDNNEKVIAIVFHVGHHENDLSDYSSTGIGSEKCRGYAVALTDAISSHCKWGVYDTKLGLYPKNPDGSAQDHYSNPSIDWSGYSYTRTIITAAGGNGSLNATEQAGYPATYYAVVDYENEVNAPANSSGWFLPSIGQMWNVYQQRGLLTSAGGSNLRGDDYWSSSESYSFPAGNALYVRVGHDRVGSSRKDYSLCCVRAVLAF